MSQMEKTLHSSRSSDSRDGQATEGSPARAEAPGRVGCGKGRGLGSAQAQMEHGFGADLSAVRVHEGDYVAELGALAYTQGTDIHFAPGMYDPSSSQGLQLLAHEVAHVMQQAQGRVAATAQAKGLPLNDDGGLEREADDLGMRVVRGERVASGWSTRSLTGAIQAKAAPIQMARPGEVEHVDNSCYAASILTLLAMVAHYRTAFDPAQNVVAGQHAVQARELQDRVHPLLGKVHGSQRVTAPEIDALVGTLHGLGLLIGERTEQQDAAQVMMAMLALVVTGGNRDQLSGRSRENRDYDQGEPVEENERQAVIQVGALGCETLEDALRMQFPTRRRVDTAHEGVDIENPHDLTRKLTHLPDVLTISVTHANDRDTLDMPQEFSVPAEVVNGIAQPPRYKLRGFIMRNHSGSGGGHYVSYVTDDQHWYHSDDMGGGPRSKEQLLEQAKELEESGGKGEKKPVATVEPRVRQVEDMSTERYGRLPAQSFALGHVYTYERIEEDDEVEQGERVGFGEVNLDPLPELPQYRPTRGTPRTRRSLTDRQSPWVQNIGGTPVDLEKLSVAQLVALLDAGKLLPSQTKSEALKLESKERESTTKTDDTPPDPDLPLLVYLTSRARNGFYESINHVPGFDPAKGSQTRRENQGPLPTEEHDERALYQRAKLAARIGSEPAQLYLRVLDVRFTRGLDTSKLNSDESREKAVEEQLDDKMSGQLAREYTQWQRERGEQVDPQHLRGTGDALAKLVKQGASPKEIVDEIIRQCPELCEKYRVECASRGMRFYEHAQMVIGQYLRYFREAEHPLVSLDAMIKAILFHDMDKKLARELGKARKSDDNPIDSQVRDKGFSGMPVDKLSQRIKGGGKSSEHSLTRVMMQKYAGLWSTIEEALIVTEIVDGDPIGHMLQAIGKDGDARAAVNTAYDEILDMAQRAGIARTDGDGIRDFYRHVKLFYQADSSSYSDDSEYAPWEERTSRTPELEHGNSSSQLAGLYQREDGGERHFAKNEQGYLRMHDQEQERALAELEERLAKIPKSEHGTARDSKSERQSWDSLPQYHWSDLEILEEIGKGSTKPLHVRDHRDKGKEKFLKLGMTRDPIHVMTEMLTNALYDEVGAPVPDFELIMIEGQPAMISTWNPKHEVPGSQSQLQQTDDFLTWVSADFLFANYDLFKLDNWSLQGARMVRADNGGALDYRAQGNQRKPLEEWERGGIGEQMSMRTVSHGTQPDPYKGLSDRRVAYSILRVCDFLDERAINRALVTAQCPAQRRAYIRGTLLDRLAIMREWAVGQIAVSEVSIQPPSEPEESIWDCFFEGLTRMVQCFRGAPPPTHTMDQAPKVTHESEDFLDKIKPLKLDKTFFEDLRRMRHGVLIRRLAIQEAQGFERAAKGGTPDERHGAVFGKQGDPWKRGEVVFSTNRAYEFKREEDKKEGAKTEEDKNDGAKTEEDKNDGAKTDGGKNDGGKNETSPETEEQDETQPLLPSAPKQDETTWSLSGAIDWLSKLVPAKEGPSLKNPNYDYVMEIPITDKALEFLESHALVQGVAWPEGYKANPNLKYERVQTGQLPNVILRGHGFENIWECFDKVRIFQPNEHISSETIPGSAEAERERLVRLQEAREQKKKEAEELKKKKKEQEDVETAMDLSLFFMNSDDDPPDSTSEGIL
jgi:hypothetical protein